MILKNISELHHQIEDLQNNNVSLEEEMSLKDEDIHQLRLEQEELLEEIERKIWKFLLYLTLTRPIGLPPHAPVAQKIADQRWLIANSAKIGTFFI